MSFKRLELPLDEDTRWLVERSKEFRRMLRDGRVFSDEEADQFFKRPEPAK